MVDRVARNLKPLGIAGTWAFCRSVADVAVVVEATAAVRAVMASEADVWNPAGVVRWLVTQELETREQQEIRVAAWTPVELWPPAHADWWDRQTRRTA